ncbi:MAG: hypothetical protein EA377_04675 [Phycisphaerales bacterium]|nr:MAG: hypothetical protein EA377_04675 [Phycisphaerales bacterium]
MPPEDIPATTDDLAESVPDWLWHDFESWRGDRQLHALYKRLVAHDDLRSFRNTLAEAMVARHLLLHHCEIRFEVETPAGRECDFEVTRDGAQFYLHVKHLITERPAVERISVPSRLRMLERIERPYIVNVRWHPSITDEQMLYLVREAEQFITHARVGEEAMVRHPKTEAEIGSLRILAPWEGTHVSLVIGLPSGYVDHASRMRRLLSRAYQQFMPRAENLILMGTTHPNDLRTFESALLGAHIERWDRFPARGKRIAYGRDEDGFWHDRRHDQSHLAGWFLLTTAEKQLQSTLWERENMSGDPDASALIASLFRAA